MNCLTSLNSREGLESLDNQKQPNELFNQLGNALSLQLMDFFVWSPFRPRDILMHGADDNLQNWKGTAALLSHICVALADTSESTLLPLQVSFHPARELDKLLPREILECACFSDQTLSKFAQWSKCLELSAQVAAAAEETDAALESRAAKRANKRNAFAFWRQQRPLLLQPLLGKTEQAIRNDWENSDLLLLLTRTLGEVLACLKRNEAQLAFSVIEKSGR